MELTKTQRWFLIIISFGLLIVNGWLVWKFVNDEVPIQCPVPVNEIGFCDCVRNALGEQNLRYCICYPGYNRFDITEDALNKLEVNNGTKN